jgi:hypothetical protein
MPLTLRLGLCKEIDRPGGGKLGVSCGVEVEIDVAALRDVEDFDCTVQEAFSVCRHAVEGELQRHDEADSASSKTFMASRGGSYLPASKSDRGRALALGGTARNDPWSRLAAFGRSAGSFF